MLICWQGAARRERRGAIFATRASCETTASRFRMFVGWAASESIKVSICPARVLKEAWRRIWSMRCDEP